VAAAAAAREAPGQAGTGAPAAVLASVGDILGHRRPTVLDGFLLLRAAGVALPADARRADVSGHGLVDASAEDLSHFACLETLDASDNALPLSCLAALPALRTLRLSCNSLAGVKIPRGTLATLQDVDLSHNMLQPRSVAALARLPGLTRLSLAGNALTDIRLPAATATGGAARRGMGGRPFPALTELDLSANRFSGNSVLRRLSSLPRLRALSLASCYLDQVPPPPKEVRLASSLRATIVGAGAAPDPGVEAASSAAAAASWFPRLETLDLSHNYVSDPAAVARLLGAPKLSRLVLTGNPVAVAPPAIAALRRRRRRRAEAATSAMTGAGDSGLSALGVGGADAAALAETAAAMGATSRAMDAVARARRRGRDGPADTAALAAAEDASALAAVETLLGGRAMARAVAAAVMGGAAEDSDSGEDGEGGVGAAARPLTAAEGDALARLDPSALLRVRVMREAAARGLVAGSGAAEAIGAAGRGRHLDLVTAGTPEDEVLGRAGPIQGLGGAPAGAAPAPAGLPRRRAGARDAERGARGVSRTRMWTVREDRLPLGREWREAGNRLLFAHSESDSDDPLDGKAGGDGWDDGGAARRIGSLPAWAGKVVRPRGPRLQDRPGRRPVPLRGSGKGAQLSSLAKLGERGVRAAGAFLHEDAADPEITPAHDSGHWSGAGASVLRSAGASLAATALAPQEQPEEQERARPDTAGSLQLRSTRRPTGTAAQWEALSQTGRSAAAAGASPDRSISRVETALEHGRGPSARLAARMLRGLLRRKPVPDPSDRGLPSYLKPSMTGRARKQAVAERRRKIGNERRSNQSGAVGEATGGVFS